MSDYEKYMRQKELERFAYLDSPDTVVVRDTVYVEIEPEIKVVNHYYDNYTRPNYRFMLTFGYGSYYPYYGYPTYGDWYSGYYGYESYYGMYYPYYGHYRHSYWGYPYNRGYYSYWGHHNHNYWRYPTHYNKTYTSYRPRPTQRSTSRDQIRKPVRTTQRTNVTNPRIKESLSINQRNRRVSSNNDSDPMYRTIRDHSRSNSTVITNKPSRKPSQSRGNTYT